MQQPPARHVRPARHARLFELLRQQAQARAAAARLAQRPPVSAEVITSLARLHGQSLLGGHPGPRQRL